MKDFLKTLSEIIDDSSSDTRLMVFEAKGTKTIDELPDGNLKNKIKSLLSKNLIGQKPSNNTKKYNGKKYLYCLFKFNKNNLGIIEDIAKEFGVAVRIDKENHYIFDFIEDDYIITMQSTGSVIDNDENGVMKLRNKGLSFEPEVAALLKSYINVPIDNVDDALVKSIMEESGLYMITTVDYKKGTAKKRADLNNFPSVKGSLVAHDIGEIITDVTINGKTSPSSKNENTKPIYLSLKNSKKVKYVNKGIANGKNGFFTKSNFAKENPEPIKKDSKADKLLNILGLKEGTEERTMFINIFRNYKKDAKGTALKRDLTNKINERVLGKIIRFAIGYGYIFVHKLGNNNYTVQNINTDAVNKKFSRISKAIANFGHTGTKEFKLTLFFTSGNQCEICMRHTHGDAFPSTFLLDWMPAPSPSV